MNKLNFDMKEIHMKASGVLMIIILKHYVILKILRVIVKSAEPFFFCQI